MPSRPAISSPLRPSMTESTSGVRNDSGSCSIAPSMMMRSNRAAPGAATEWIWLVSPKRVSTSMPCPSGRHAANEAERTFEYGARRSSSTSRA